MRCRLALGRNSALPVGLQQNTYVYDETQNLLQQISAYYAPIDAHCRSAMICVLGVRKFKRNTLLAKVGKDVARIIARMMWNDCVDGNWSTK